MDIKSKTKRSYNKSASLWHETRVTTLDNFSNEKLLKQNRPHLFIEKPAMYSKVPNLEGKDVLCLGCGSGEECGDLLKKNPKSLIGIDLSNKLIEIAKRTYLKVKFYVMDVENLEFPDNSFDFVYSSLVLDYMENWEKVLSEVYRVLKKGGIFLFSNIHPIKWAAHKTKDEDGKNLGAIMGFNKNPKTGKIEIYGDYLNTRVHKEVWMKNIEIFYYTKSISKMYQEIVSSGLRVLDVLEPKAISETKRYDQDYYKINQKIPNFIIFETQKMKL